MKVRSLLALFVAVAVLANCGRPPSLKELDAPPLTVPSRGTLEPIALDLTSIRGGPPAATVSMAPTTVPATLGAVGTVTTVLGLADTLPEPATTLAPPPPARVTTTVAVPPRTTPPVATTVTTATKPRATTPTPMSTLAPDTSPATVVAPLTNPTTTAAAFAVINSACRNTDVGRVRATKEGPSVVCARTKKRRRWVAVATTTAPSTAVNNRPALGPGFDGTTIRVGLLTTTTNPVWGPIGRAISAGIEARVAAINRRGGIGGRYRMVVVKAETNYDPTETLTQIQATKANVVAYVSLLGTPSTEAAEPVLRSEGLIASPASQEARWSTAPTLLPVFNSYQVQAINGLAYFAEQFAVTNPGVRPVVCGVSVATSFGEAGSEGIRAAAQVLPITLGPIVGVAPTENAFVSAVGTLKGAGCQATFLTVGPAQTLGVVLTGRQLAFANRWIIMGASFSDRIVTPQTGPLFEQGAWVVGDGTQWGDESVAGMVQMRADLLASDNRYWTENPDVGLSYGWAQARTIEQLLETAVRRNDLSRVGMLAASQAMGPVDLGGIGSPIDYSQPVRLANARTTIFNVDNSYRNAIRVLARDFSSPAAAAYRR